MWMEYVFNHIHVAHHGKGSASLHKCAFKFCVQKADLAFFVGADGLGIAFALKRGNERSGLFLPLALRAYHFVALFYASKGHLARVRRADDYFAVGRSLYFVQQCRYVYHAWVR